MRQSLLSLLVLGFLLIGCERSDSGNGGSGGGAGGAATQGSASSDKKITVALLPKQKGIPYFTTCAAGAEAAAKELGNVELIYDGPMDGKAENAASMIERWMLRGVDVIAVSPNDPKILAPAMKKAQEKGVKVITWDADGEPGTRAFFVNQATAQDIGFALVDTLAADIARADGKSAPADAEGEIAIVTATLTAANQNAWMDHMKQRLASNFPKLKLVDVKPCDEDQKKAFQITQDLMNAYPNLKGVFAISSAAFPGSAEAIKQAGKSGKVQVTGLSTPNEMKKYVEDGTVKSVILWNTNDLGYLTIQTANALANGTLKPGDTKLSAGRLGEKEVRGDNVLLGKILVFTKENIGQFNF